MIGLGVVLLPLMYLLNNFKLAYGFIIVILMFLIRDSIVKKKKDKSVSLQLQTAFSFKVFVSPNSGNSTNKTFIHSKIYIIDDEIAYLGSLNFTGSGVKDNHETRIRTTDPEAVAKIIEE
jgi:phosphatidylserine/phosphatidylglycerophosphate/cardiolipin synthase-like enzyme